MDFLTLISNKDILYEITKRVKQIDLARLIYLCKKLRDLVGTSKVWLSFDLLGPHVSDANIILKYFTNNSLLFDNFVIRGYYDSPYYLCFIRYLLSDKKFRWNLAMLVKNMGDFKRIAEAIDIITGNTDLQAYKSVRRCMSLLNQIVLSPIFIPDRYKNIYEISSIIYPVFIRFDDYDNAYAENELILKYVVKIGNKWNEFNIGAGVDQVDKDKICLYDPYHQEHRKELSSFCKNNFVLPDIDAKLLAGITCIYLLGNDSWNLLNGGDIKKKK